MRWLSLVALLLLTPFLVSTAAQGQTQTFDRGGVEYTLELPSSSWRAETRIDVHEHVEFIYGDREEGYLRLRKNLVDARTTPDALFRRDEKQSLQFLPGYVICDQCKGEKFLGHLSGVVFQYEFTSGGKPLAGRIYYLQVDSRTIYTLHFTAAREKLNALLDQMDFIARSFRMKESSRKLYGKGEGFDRWSS